MLNNLFYYNFYKQFLVSDQITSAKKASGSGIGFARAVLQEKQPLMMNKTYNTKIVDYAGRIAGGLNSLNASLKYILGNIDSFNDEQDGQQNSSNYGHSTKAECDNIQSELANNFSSFTYVINKVIENFSNQPHSKELTSFADNLSFMLIKNPPEFKELGFSMTEGTLNFDRDTVTAMSNRKFGMLLNINGNFFSELNDYTLDMMSVPLSNYMNFKGFGYYYSYKLGGAQADTFHAIESGLLIDVAV